jgi:hypothetical protein
MVVGALLAPIYMPRRIMERKAPEGVLMSRVHNVGMVHAPLESSDSCPVIPRGCDGCAAAGGEPPSVLHQGTEALNTGAVFSQVLQQA